MFLFYTVVATPPICFFISLRLNVSAGYVTSEAACTLLVARVREALGSVRGPLDVNFSILDTMCRPTLP